jgi:glutamate formiminotransferase / 5-formyltetrahydrofolate cyclo-ligase
VAVPNVSEGRDPDAARAIGAAFEAGGGARLLDVHADPDHNRAVYTLAGRQGELAGALVAGAHEVLARVDLAAHDGVHPHVGAIDVAPVVHLVPQLRGAACAEALVAADLLARELELPVFLYGALADGRTRAEVRRGGPAELGRRMAAGELAPDFGPPLLHPTGGAALVAARPPLIAFNVELAPPATLEDARRIASRIRQGGEEGLPGVRAIGLALERQGIVQVSTNVEDHVRVPLAAVVEAVARHAAVSGAEVVGVPPRAAYEGWPDEVALRNRQVLEELLDGLEVKDRS